MTWTSGSAFGDVVQELRDVVDVVEDAGDEDHRQEHDVRVGRRRLEVRDHVRERDAERGEADDAERRVKTTRSSQFCGQPRPKTKRLGEHDDRDLDAGVRGGVAEHAREVGAGRQRRAVHPLEHARSRRNVIWLASALNVVAITRQPGDARDDDLQVLLARRSRRTGPGTAAAATKLKNAARRVAPEHPALEAVLAPGEGRRRSCAGLLRGLRGRDLGGQLEVDVLEARARDRQVAQRLAAGERAARQLVQQRASGRSPRACAARRARRASSRGSATRRAERRRRALGERSRPSLTIATRSHSACASSR